MSYIVKDNEFFYKFDRFVNDMSIVTSMEIVGSYHAATEFKSEATANMMLQEAEKAGYNISQCKIYNKDDVEKEEKERAEKESRDIAINAWANTSEETKRKKLREILDNKGEEKMKEWLEYVEDTSGIQPADPEDKDNAFMLKIQNALGISLSDSQKEKLLKVLEEK